MGYYYPSGPLGPVCDVVLTDEQKKGLRPPPVTAPDPFNVIGIIYTIVQFSPVPIVTATPLLIVIGPADIAL